MDETKLVGGTAEDRRRLVERMEQYLDVNGRFDWEALQDLWSGAPEAVLKLLLASPIFSSSDVEKFPPSMPGVGTVERIKPVSRTW